MLHLGMNDHPVGDSEFANANIHRNMIVFKTIRILLAPTYTEKEDDKNWIEGKG